MEKPTIFFSHSSKDREMILPIKNKIDGITGKSLNVFMSSDGQSIPFGRNWIHKIEEGLNDAQIMFIFVTPNSIKSEWIYFEAGFAYSKGIKVIPVGIGINIGQLKAPLNLLQGFDITSADSMNNFISIINRTFELSFKEEFCQADYVDVKKAISNDVKCISLSDIFSNAYYELYSQYIDNNDKTKVIRYNIDKFFANIIEFLKMKSIQHSFSDNEILTSGIRIKLYGKEEEPNETMINQKHKISFTLSTYHFEESFNLLMDLFSLFTEEKGIGLEFEFNTSYSCLIKAEHLSSIITSASSKIIHNEGAVGCFRYLDKVNIWVSDVNRYERTKTPLYKVVIYFKRDNILYIEIVRLFEILVDNNIIYRVDA